MGTIKAGGCFHSFPEFRMFSQTFTSISATQEKLGEDLFYFFGKHFHYVNSLSKFCVFLNNFMERRLLACVF